MKRSVIVGAIERVRAFCSVQPSGGVPFDATHRLGCTIYNYSRLCNNIIHCFKISLPNLL